MPDYSIIHGNRFVLCDHHGDISTDAHGLFVHDARHVSHLVVRIDGRRPQQLGAPQGNHHERRFVQRNIRSPQLTADALLLRRHVVLCGDALHVRLELENVTQLELEAPVSIELRADFDDLFTVKDREFELRGDDPGEVGPHLRAHRERHPMSIAANAVQIVDPEAGAECIVTATYDFDVDVDALRWHARLDPRGTWRCDLTFAWDTPASEGFDAALERVRDDRRRWHAHTPDLFTSDEALHRAWHTSIDDLAALHIADPAGEPDDLLVAAGAPWFMTVFGRDSCITCLQTMALGARRARGVLRYLARTQATTNDPDRDAEPGKILHEVRAGRLAESGYDFYYGSVDSTPLFLMLVGEYHAWTRDDALIHELLPNIEAAIGWIDAFDGWLTYERRSRTGLENQSWKDSWDSQRHADGTLATGAIAPVEAQAYAVAAYRAIARILRHVVDDPARAATLEQRADQLSTRIDEVFWVTLPDGSETYALALAGDGAPLRTLTSNIGHVLWSDAAQPARVAQVAAQLASDTLFSGWGVRTMSRDEHAYNPISYHCGTVWPHDTSIAVAGLARAGFPDPAASIARGLIDCAGALGGRLPEVFAGLPRDETGSPVPYPTASCPQAWAAGSIIQLVTALLGLRPDPAAGQLVSDAERVPEWLDGAELRGVHALDLVWDVSVHDGRVAIAARS